MSRSKLRLDLSGVNDFPDLYDAFARTLGFPAGKNHVRDALRDHLTDVSGGGHKHVNLKPGETLLLGVFGLGGLRRRNAHLAREFEKIIERANEGARYNKHGAPYFECVSIPGLNAEF
jgi:hypothetical protein